MEGRVGWVRILLIFQSHRQTWKKKVGRDRHHLFFLLCIAHLACITDARLPHQNLNQDNAQGRKGHKKSKDKTRCSVSYAVPLELLEQRPPRVIANTRYFDEATEEYKPRDAIRETDKFKADGATPRNKVSTCSKKNLSNLRPQRRIDNKGAK